MPEVASLSWKWCSTLAEKLAKRIISEQGFNPVGGNKVHVYPIPNGGIFAAQLLQAANSLFVIDEVPDSNTQLYIDDIIDSGNTRLRTIRYLGRKDFYALVNKQEETELQGKWISFPWERMQKKDGPHDNITRLIEYIGDDPERPGLVETPNRIVKSYDEIFAGYKQKPQDFVKVFEESTSDNMVILKNCEFFSSCEHHMIPFTGRAHLAYIPDKNVGEATTYRVIGLSKMARIFDVFARRLQIQERISAQFVDFLMNSELKPIGAACVIEATHFCMCSRGVNKQHSSMITSSVAGVFREPQVRAEFMALVKP
jgi:GTP cyclohydrolase I